jgi:universal stress protein E
MNHMTHSSEFQRILVATDFSPHSETALKQAIWLARKSRAQIVLTHVLPDLRKALLSASPNAQFDVFVGEGEQFQNEIRKESDAHMRTLIANSNAEDLDIRCETLLGEPYISIIHAVQQEKYDLVMVGTKGQSAWEKLFLGSTAKRLIRCCPVPVWTVKAEHDSAPKVVLAATDFSDVGRSAVQLACQIARQADSEFHLLHVIDSTDIPEGAIERMNPGGAMRGAINEVAANRLTEFIKSLDIAPVKVHSHLTWGIPSQGVARLAEHLEVDLLVLGTVGRSGIKGVLLGNTAEKVLDTCNCSILTVKPDDFISPIEPPFWPLHPNSKTNSKG